LHSFFQNLVDTQANASLRKQGDHIAAQATRCVHKLYWNKRIAMVNVFFAADRKRLTGAVALALAFGIQTGCSSTPSSVEAPSIDADDAAQKAIALYDKSGDAILDTAELANSPGLLMALKVYDANGDQKISEEELSERIASWSSSGPAMMTVDCRVTVDGRPLPGANVRYVPESYFDGALHEGVGVTSENGMATIAIAPENLAEGLKRIRAMNAGTYKVQVTHPTVKIPEKYNVQTTLGTEVSRPTTPSPYEEFKLTSK
jgi:hypothetical protein